MLLTFADLERAQLPAAALGRLAALRCENGVEIALHERDLWVRWSPGHDEVARALLPLPGCRLYGRHDGRWYAWGRAVPAFEVPQALRFRPLCQVIFPAPIQPIPARFTPAPVALTLVADPVFRPTQALECPLDLFLAWADMTPACALEKYQGAIRGDRLMVLGKKLPWLDQAERFWGISVLVPIGFRPEPCLAESDLRRAAGIAEADVLILRPERLEIFARDRFTPLTHASLRLAGTKVMS